MKWFTIVEMIDVDTGEIIEKNKHLDYKWSKTNKVTYEKNENNQMIKKIIKYGKYSVQTRIDI